MKSHLKVLAVAAHGQANLIMDTEIGHESNELNDSIAQFQLGGLIDIAVGIGLLGMYFAIITGNVVETYVGVTGIAITASCQ